MRAEFFQVCVLQHLHSFPSDACCTSGTVLSRNLGRWEQNTCSAGICVLSASLMKISNKKILAATGVRKNCCPSGRVQAMQSQNIIPRKSQKRKKNIIPHTFISCADHPSCLAKFHPAKPLYPLGVVYCAEHFNLGLVNIRKSSDIPCRLALGLETAWTMEAGFNCNLYSMVNNFFFEW